MTVINLDTLRIRAAKFAKNFENIKSEKQNDQDFMREFCAIFDISSHQHFANYHRWFCLYFDCDCV